MQITDYLLRRFFANECSEEEAVLVSDYLRNNPGKADEYLASHWNKTDGTGNLPIGYKEEMLHKIRMGIAGDSPSRTSKYIKSLAMAASLLLLIAATWWLATDKPAAPSKTKIITQRTPETNQWQIKKNITDTLIKIALDDGSTITLSPHAMVKYMKPFVDNKRDVYLEGEAFFEISKNKAMPFTVYSCSFSTTALGTSFLVSESKTGCTVNLYTGKVVVKAISKSLKGWNGDVYLLPGQQLQYNATKSLVVLSKTGDKHGPVKIKQLQPVTAKKNSEELAFDNAPLAVVMDRISKKYHVTIEYNKNDITGMYFTGSVLKHDSLSVILKAIAQMNGLVIIPNEKGYLVRQSQ